MIVTREGTAVILLPWHDPVLLAERAATLDLMSGGRLDFGVGKGYRHSEFAGFCIPYEEAQARFEEALEVIIRAWTSNARFSHNERFWHRRTDMHRTRLNGDGSPVFSGEEEARARTGVAESGWKGGRVAVTRVGVSGIAQSVALRS